MQKDELLAMLWGSQQKIVCIFIDELNTPNELHVSYLDNPLVTYKLMTKKEVKESWDELVAGKILSEHYFNMLCEPKCIQTVIPWKKGETPMISFEFTSRFVLSLPYRNDKDWSENYLWILKFLSTEQDTRATAPLNTTKH